MLQHFAFNFQVPPEVNDASRDIDGNIPRGAQFTSTLSPIVTHLTSQVSASRFACSLIVVKKIVGEEGGAGRQKGGEKKREGGEKKGRKRKKGVGEKKKGRGEKKREGEKGGREKKRGGEKRGGRKKGERKKEREGRKKGGSKKWRKTVGRDETLSLIDTFK